MTSQEIFESSIRPDGRLAGVYEQDSDTGYFYLYDLEKPEGQKIIAAIQLHAGDVSLAGDDVSIRWNRDGSVVGVFVKGTLSAAFSERGKKWQCELADEDAREVPEWVHQAFALGPPH